MLSLNNLTKLVLIVGTVFAETCKWNNVELSRFDIDNKKIEKAKSPAILYTRHLESQCKANITYDTCFIKKPDCSGPREFRSYNGSCNNLKHPTWGLSNTTFVRILPAFYSDGRYLPRLAVDGSELPSARALSIAFFPDDVQDDNVTLISMQWGQFVAHDLASTLNPVAKQCCHVPNTTRDFYEECLPIYYPSDDPFFKQYNITCQEMTRIKVTLSGDNCKKGPLQQVNSNTHSIDGSLIYGSTSEVAKTVRKFSGGLLQEKVLNGRQFLPTTNPDQCNGKYCFVAGDNRVNQNTELTVLQILLLREHNRVAGILSSINPNWNDEMLFQKTRSIISSMIQHITYSHWLPLFLGENLTKTLKISPKCLKYTTYNANIPVMILSEFNHGVFRSFHAGIQGILSIYNYRRNPLGSVNISDWMLNPDIILQENNFDGFLLGLITQRMVKLETYYTKEMTEKLFKRPNKPFGLDLESFDINRGRDGGVAPYIYLLESCTGKKIKKFDDLSTVMPKKKITKLRKYYKDVRDVDLFIAIHLENKVPGTRVGPTSLCILGEQFYRLMFGDRFWYTHGGFKNSFPKSQLAEIRKSSISRLICDNSDSIINVTRNVFLPASPANLESQCNANINYDTCFMKTPDCSGSTEFRSYNGSCNNLKHPTWGMSNTTSVRILSAFYSDGRYLPRLAVDGSELPSARALSIAFFPDGGQDDNVTLISMQWGQLVTHDLANTLNSVAKQCCYVPNTTKDFYEECLPIYYPSDDPFFIQYNITCQEMTRTKATLSGDDCKKGPLQQIIVIMNSDSDDNVPVHIIETADKVTTDLLPQISMKKYNLAYHRFMDWRQKNKLNSNTHSIDGSPIYGSTSELANTVRKFSGGLLQEKILNGKKFPPTTISDLCDGKYCFVAGDDRLNQNTELAVLQILLLREHNRIAGILSNLNPNWNDGMIFQKTRSIMISTIQHVTYSQWLPLFLGEKLMKTLKISPDSLQYTTYNPNIPMMVLNEFNQGVFRSFHAGIQGILTIYNYRRNPLRSVNISDWMFNNDIILQENNFDGFLLGVITQRMLKMETFYTKEMTEKLFKRPTEPFGLDLESFDINRGRDAGVAPYIYLLEGCTGKKIKKFDDLSTVMSKEKITKLQKYYKDVRDVDLFIAIHLERKVPGTRVGSTSLCILGEQFYRLMFGDRFWYTHGGLKNSFTKCQLAEIRKSSISRLICDNSDSIVNVTQNVFLPDSPANPIVPCKNIPQLDLSKWKE